MTSFDRPPQNHAGLHPPLNQAGFRAIARRYPSLQIGVLGDFCLDRYLEINPARNEISLETGLPVYNVVNVRCQAGAAGTVLNNLSALGIGKLFPIGFCGADGEGYELLRALHRLQGVRLDHFRTSSERRTFTYTKPLLLRKGKSPRELNRLDIKNWSETPRVLQERLSTSVLELGPRLDALVVVDQAPLFGMGTITRTTLSALEQLQQRFPGKVIIADSRANLRRFPSVLLKMNRRELGEYLHIPRKPPLAVVKELCARLSHKTKQPVIVTLAEKGICAAAPGGQPFHAPAFPVHGPLDIVGAGDAVTANFAAALGARASLPQAVAVANAAASVVVHKVGTTGTASVTEILACLPA